MQSNANMCATPKRQAAGPRRSGQRLLAVVAEPDPACAARFASVLAELGADVAIAHDGFCGLLLAAEARPTLVVTALRMPAFSGWNMIRILKADPAFSHVPIIAIGRDGDDDTGLPPGVAAMRAPVDDGMLKALAMPALRGEPVTVSD